MTGTILSVNWFSYFVVELVLLGVKNPLQPHPSNEISVPFYRVGCSSKGSDEHLVIFIWKSVLQK